MADQYLQPNPQQPVNPEPSQPMAAPPQQGGSGWIAWVVGIVIAILVGSGLYYYYQYIKMPELENEKSSLENQVNSLQDQLDEAEAAAEEAAPEGNTQPAE